MPQPQEFNPSEFSDFDPKEFASQPQPDMRGFFTKPLVPLTESANRLDAPSLTRSPAAARLRGFGAGALEALGTQTSPLNIALNLPYVGMAGRALGGLRLAKGATTVARTARVAAARTGLAERAAARAAAKAAPKAPVPDDFKRLVLLPDEAQRAAWQAGLTQRGASEQGMRYAAYGKTGAPGGADRRVSALPKLLRNERGAVSLGMGPFLAKAALQARSASMLSGLALPKSILGNLSALATAVGEGQTSARTVAGQLVNPKTLRAIKVGWKHKANPAEISGYGGVNLPGRAMGTLDRAAQNVLGRAGVVKPEAQRLLLTRSNPMAAALKEVDPHGLAVPFRKTPTNQFLSGLEELGKLATNPVSRRAALTAGSVGAGVAAGNETKDPRLLGLGSAAMSVRGLPFLLGASAGAGHAALSGASPLPEWGMPALDLKSLKRWAGLNPAFINAYMKPDRPALRLRQIERR